MNISKIDPLRTMMDRVNSVNDIQEDTLRKISEDCGISVDQVEDVYACTPYQLGVMADSNMEGVSYMHTFTHSLDASLNSDLLCDAIHELVSLNQVLRSRIVDCDLGLVQVVVKEHHRVQRPRKNLQDYIADDRSRPMDLGTPLLRFAIVEQKLITTVHHAVGDRRSFDSFLADVWSVYQGHVPNRHAQFKEFVEYCGSIDDAKAKAFWAAQFKGSPTIYPHVDPEHNVAALKEITKQVLVRGTSMALMPSYIELAWAMTAGEYTNSDSVAFGFVFSGRTPALAGTETTLGPTIATVPIQIDLKREMTIERLLKERFQARRATQMSPALQCGLLQIRKVSEAARIASKFQTVLNILPMADSRTKAAGMIFDKEFDVRRAYSLLFECSLNIEGVLIKASFDNAVLDERQVHRILRQIGHNLNVLVNSPPQTPLKRLQRLTSGDDLEILEWNRTIPAAVEKSLQELVSAKALEFPTELAVDAWDGNATYCELVERATRLAHELRRRGVSNEVVVPVLLSRSIWHIVAVLAVLIAGGTYVPLDIAHPRARNEAILHITKAKTVLTSTAHYAETADLAPHVMALDSRVLDELPRSTEVMSSHSSADSAAYIMFTSGSTGIPKGVVLEHRSLATSLGCLGHRLGWRPGTRVLQFATHVWDTSIWETLGALLFGGCICIPSQDARESGLAAYINSANIDSAVLTPTVLRTLVPQDVPCLRTLVSAGEAVSPDAATIWGSKLQFFNGWGPCETSVCAALAELTPHSPYPDTIGASVGSALWIVDCESTDQLVPIGVVGEILVESPGVARGYLSDPVQTAAFFIGPPPWAPRRSGTTSRPQRFYRTGDLARYNPDGSIAFIGRQDNQVKIRGQRFETGEVEQVLARHGHVRSTYVTTLATKVSPQGGKELVAVLALTNAEILGGGILEEASSDSQRDLVALLLHELNEFAITRLPSYMVPTVWLVVGQMPQTASTKIDRQKINEWLQSKDFSTPRDAPKGRASDSVTAPRSAAERLLQHAWSSVLDVPEAQIGTESSFVRLGGDSISAMQVATRCRRHGFRITVSVLLRRDSLAAAAKEMEELREASAMPKFSAAEEASNQALSPIQRLFSDGAGPASNNHFNQSFILTLKSGITPSALQILLNKLVVHHAMLRARFSYSSTGTLVQRIVPESIGVWRFRVHADVNEAKVQSIVDDTQTSLDIIAGPVFAADVITLQRQLGRRILFLAAHHLVIDLVSWRIIWEDLETLLRDPACTLPPSLPFPLWMRYQTESLKQPLSVNIFPKANLQYWNMHNRVSTMADIERKQFNLDSEKTGRIMGICNIPFGTSPTELVLTALLLSFSKTFSDRGAPALFCEGHGRESNNLSYDPSRTVGWFTTMLPLEVPISAATPIELAVMAVKDCYRGTLPNGRESFASRMLRSNPLGRHDIELLFNYVGRMQQVDREDGLLKRISPTSVKLRNVAGDAEHVGLISVAAFFEDQSLHFWIDHNRHMAHQDLIDSWVQGFERCLLNMAVELPAKEGKLTLSDLPLLQIDRDALNIFENLKSIHARFDELGIAGSNVESMYPCSPVQEGILFAQLKGQTNEYRDRFTLRLTCREADGILSIEKLVDAWQAVCNAHPILRTIFTSGSGMGSAFQQIVLKHVDPSLLIMKIPSGSNFATLLQNLERPRFTPKETPHRLSLCQETKSVIYAILDISHAILDVRTLHLIMEEFGQAYTHSGHLTKGHEFSEFIALMQNQRDSSRQYWRSYLSGARPCLLRAACADSGSNMKCSPQEVDVPLSDIAKIHSFCQQQDATVANFMQAVWGIVLRLLTGASFVYFGCLYSQQDAFEGAHRTLGPLLTMLVCKFRIDPSSNALSLLATAGDDSARAFQHLGSSLGQIHEDIGLSSSPLFDTAMSIQHSWPSDLAKDSDIKIEMVDGEDPTEVSSCTVVLMPLY